MPYFTGSSSAGGNGGQSRLPHLAADVSTGADCHIARRPRGAESSGVASEDRRSETGGVEAATEQRQTTATGQAALNLRDVRAALKLGYIDPKWDKSGTF